MIDWYCYLAEALCRGIHAFHIIFLSPNIETVEVGLELLHSLFFERIYHKN